MKSTGETKATIYGVLSIGVLTAFWGVIEYLGMSIADTYPMTQIVVMRYAVHLIVLLVACRLLGAAFTIRTERPLTYVGLGSCMWIMPASFIFTLDGMSSATQWSAFWLMPVFVLLISMRFLREPVGLRVWIAIAVAHVGALLILQTNTSLFSPLAVFPMLGGIGFATYAVLARHLKYEPAAKVLFYTGLIPFIGMLPFALMTWAPIQPEDVLRIVGIGVIGLIMLYCLEHVMKLLTAAFVAPLLYGALVSELAVALILYGELPGLWQLLGCLILLAVAIAIVTDRHLATKKLAKSTGLSD